MIKKAIGIIILLTIVIGCKKDKLEGETSILEGKWKWVYSLEEKHNFLMGGSTYQDVSASIFPDAYFMEFDRKGKVKFLKNETIEEKYRIVMSIFRDEDNCEFLNCKKFSIYLDNKDDQELTGYMNQDTIHCAGQPLPLSTYSAGSYRYSYSHYYLRAN